MQGKEHGLAVACSAARVSHTLPLLYCRPVLGSVPRDSRCLSGSWSCCSFVYSSRCALCWLTLHRIFFVLPPAFPFFFGFRSQRSCPPLAAPLSRLWGCCVFGAGRPLLPLSHTEAATSILCVGFPPLFVLKLFNMVSLPLPYSFSPFVLPALLL